MDFVQTLIPKKRIIYIAAISSLLLGAGLTFYLGQQPPPKSVTTTFGRVSYLEKPITLPSYGNPAWGDFNSDGLLDLFVVNHDNPPSLLRNNGDGTFADITQQAGIQTKIEDRHGAALGDYDNDGDLDLFITIGASWGKTLGIKKDLFYRNLGGGRFSEIAESLNLINQFGRGRSAHWIDYNRDGWLDLFIKNLETPNLLLENQSGETFINAAGRAGLADIAGNHASWTDYDRDGDLDLLALAPGAELWQQDASGTFLNITSATRLKAGTRGERGAAWGDYNNDGRIDLYISTGYKDTAEFLSHTSSTIVFSDERNAEVRGLDFTSSNDKVAFDLYYQPCRRPETVFIGQDGTNPAALPVILEKTEAAGIPSNLQNSADTGFFIWFSQGEWHIRWRGNQGYAKTYFFGAIKTEGEFKTVRPFNFKPVSVPKTRGGTLYKNSPNGTFSDVTKPAGLVNSGNNRAAVWGDYDNDGYLDLFITNAGTVTENGRNFLYRNNGNNTFMDITVAAGLGDISPGRNDGASWGDFDNDGFLDLYITNGWDQPNLFPPKNQRCLQAGSQYLYRNNGNDNNWIKIVLRGTISNRDGVGSKMWLKTSDSKQFREIINGNGGDLFSQGREPAHFGLGNATSVESLTIEWPSGITQTIYNIPTNQTMDITEQKNS